MFVFCSRVYELQRSVPFFKSSERSRVISNTFLFLNLSRIVGVFFRKKKRDGMEYFRDKTCTGGSSNGADIDIQIS